MTRKGKYVKHWKNRNHQKLNGLHEKSILKKEKKITKAIVMHTYNYQMQPTCTFFPYICKQKKGQLIVLYW